MLKSVRATQASPLHLQAHHRPVQDRRAVRVDRHALLRVKRHARLAALGEGDEVAAARAQVVVDHQRLARLPRLAGKHVAVLHLDYEEPPADERVVERLEADVADDAAYPPDANSSSCRPITSVTSRRARTKRPSMFFICWSD